MRRGEILALRWSDLDADLTVARVRRTLQTAGGKLQFVEPKTKRSRRAVELPAFVRPYLEGHRREQAKRKASECSWTEHDLVITRRDGRPVNPDTLSSGWYRFCRRRGLPNVRFHDLRHAHATLMLLQGVHPRSCRSASATRASVSRSIRTHTCCPRCRPRRSAPSTSSSPHEDRDLVERRPAVRTRREGKQ